MISLLSQFMIKDRDNITSIAVRKAYGILCSSVGIFLNIILFAIKYFAGIFSGSVAITADAFNNLSDTGSSIVTLLGFQLGGQEADDKHPFGYARVEYLSGLAVAILIVIMALKLAQTSIVKIMYPRPVAFHLCILAILCISIAVKLYMFFYNKQLGKKLQSPAMQATAIDSLADCLATTAVFFATLTGHFTGYMIDGWCGILVAVFILYSGLKSGKENINALLGQAPAKEFIYKIQEIVMSHEQIINFHDLIVHDYGPTHCMISFHVEVPASKDVLELHHIIEQIQAEIQEQLGCEAVIHADPVCIDDKETKEAYQKITMLVQCIDDNISIHDFCMEKEPLYIKLFFNVVIPFQFRLSDEELMEKIKSAVCVLDDRYCASIHIKKSYI